MKRANHLEDLGVDERITLKWALRKYDGRRGLDLTGL